MTPSARVSEVLAAALTNDSRRVYNNLATKLSLPFGSWLDAAEQIVNRNETHKSLLRLTVCAPMLHARAGGRTTIFNNQNWKDFVQGMRKRVPSFAAPASPPRSRHLFTSAELAQMWKFLDACSAPNLLLIAAAFMVNLLGARRAACWKELKVRHVTRDGTSWVIFLPETKTRKTIGDGATIRLPTTNGRLDPGRTFGRWMFFVQKHKKTEEPLFSLPLGTTNLPRPIYNRALTAIARRCNIRPRGVISAHAVKAAAMSLTEDRMLSAMAKQADIGMSTALTHYKKIRNAQVEDAVRNLVSSINQ